MFTNILVVCVGNICRSPTAARLLQHYQPALCVTSAGLGALVGREADATARSVALAHGISLDGHSARQLSAAMCRDVDVILVMEKRHVHTLCELAPETRGKVMLFGHWDRERDIPDPYRKSRDAFEAVYALLDHSARLWAQALTVQQEQP